MRKRLANLSRRRLVYFSLSLAVALAALATQFSSPRAVAQRPLPDEPTEECRLCDERCSLAFEVCTAEFGGRGPGFGQCMRARQQCLRTCHERGGPCDRRAADQVPSPSPTPSPSPD